MEYFAASPCLPWQCATLWPPLMAATGASASGDWSIVTRDDGSKQWAYKGKPVYYWSKDQKAGDRTGDGVANARRLARPANSVTRVPCSFSYMNCARGAPSPGSRRPHSSR